MVIYKGQRSRGRYTIRRQVQVIRIREKKKWNTWCVVYTPCCRSTQFRVFPRILIRTRLQAMFFDQCLEMFKMCVCLHRSARQTCGIQCVVYHSGVYITGRPSLCATKYIAMICRMRKIAVFRKVENPAKREA